MGIMKRTTHGNNEMGQCIQIMRGQRMRCPYRQLAYFKDPAGAILQVSFIKTYGTSLGFNGIDENTNRMHH
jgi:hypothetical protein